MYIAINPVLMHVSKNNLSTQHSKAVSIRKCMMNLQNKSKICSYIGLAMRSGRILLGEDKITERLRSCVVVLIDESATDKYKERLMSKCSSVPTFVLDCVTSAVHREQVFAIAITDSGLGNAILENLR